MSIPNTDLHRIVATAIIHKDSKFLIIKRSPDKKAFPNKWTVPGGGLESDDYINTPKTNEDAWYFSLENSLRREIREETNLEVGKINYLVDLTFIRPDKTPGLVLSFYTAWKSGEVKLDSDGVEYAWVSSSETKNYDLISGIAEEIEMTDKILKGEDPENVKFEQNV